MKTVAIVGVGLIGGSFALALRKAGFAGRILGVSSPAATAAALERGVIDEAASLERATAEADLLYLAQPIRRILETLTQLDAWLRPEALVTDAGSTKAQIVETARRHIRKAQFLGGHPMAGKEKRGVEIADANLFAGRTYVLTPDGPRDLETPAAQQFIDWIRRIGGVPVVLEPAEHDKVVSLTSHLPQLASTALAATLARRLSAERHRAVAGPGLMDMTRLAMSSHEIWRDILETNREPVETALDAYIEELRQIRASLTSEHTAGEFELAGDFAQKIRHGGDHA
ncbi:MAG: prephenate dehydrogenase [Bryobacteraceae bacterium]